ncbi:conserved hypothetical protein [Altererythrobacter sp. B11]|nr:conserved hypothetical protein [Altererythrobacter sp. B11]
MGPHLRQRADPTAAIAADIAFAQLAQREGQWKAFRKTAADDAVLFAPGPVPAKGWLEKQPEPAQSVAWQPHSVISSCDGTLAATFGAAQWPDGKQSEYVTVWQRKREKSRDRDSEYKWVLDSGDFVEQAPKRPEFVQTQVADCKTPPKASAAPAGGMLSRAADDGTLRYDYVAAPGGGVLTLSWWDGTEFREAYRQQLAPSAGQ